MSAGRRFLFAKAALFSSIVVSLILLSLNALGDYDLYRATHRGSEVPPEVLAQLRAQGIPTDQNNLSGFQEMDFASHTVVHVTPTSLFIFLPFLLVIIAYVAHPPISKTTVGKVGIILAAVTFLIEVGMIILFLNMP
jgi:hypothetical protein